MTWLCDPVVGFGAGGKREGVRGRTLLTFSTTG